MRMFRCLFVAGVVLGLVLGPVFGCFGAATVGAGAGNGLTRHIVCSGETLFGIARANDLHVAEVKKLNGLKSNLIHPGQLLLLPGAAKKKQPSPRVSQAKAPPAKAAKGGKSKVSPDLPPLAMEKIPTLKGDVQAAALAFLATPYSFGAEGRAATDCSGFTQQVFAGLGLNLPRTARAQIGAGALVSEKDWQNGDLLFFRTYARYPSHVGIYLGDGKMIHASRSQRQVVISDINRPYFRKRLIGARRVAHLDPPVVSLQGHRFAEVNDEGLLEADLGAAGVTETVDATEIYPPAPSAPPATPVITPIIETSVTQGSSQVTATLPMDHGVAAVLTVREPSSSRE